MDLDFVLILSVFWLVLLFAPSIFLAPPFFFFYFPSFVPLFDVP